MLRADHHERGERHQASLARRGRRRPQGAFYTPAEVVDVVLDLVLQPELERRAHSGGAEAIAAIRVLDPACGTGNFLVAAHARVVAALEAAGCSSVDARAAATRCMHGVDIDAEAVAVCRQALAAAGSDTGAVPAMVEVVCRQIRVADALAAGTLTPRWFHVVVGNPPFLGQLAADTARRAADTAALRAHFGAVISPYTDPAWVFLLVAADAVAVGGRAALVQPASVLAARDGEGVRRAVSSRAALRGLWAVGARVFDADVEVVVPVLEAIAHPSSEVTVGMPVDGDRDEGRSVELRAGRSGVVVGSAPLPRAPGASWAPLLAAARAVPTPTLHVDGVLAEIAEATADFRDQYYGLANHVVDRVDADPSAFPPLVTAGLIDPAASGWGHRPTRIHKQTWIHPRVRVSGLPEALQGWVRRRQVPKVLVATQTRVPEALVDEAGTVVGSVPVITVTPRAASESPELLWLIGAVLTCPPIAALACVRHGGTGRNAAALRLRAADLGAFPLPADRAGWRRGAAHLRAAHRAHDLATRRHALGEVAVAMTEAYGLPGDDPVIEWWLAQVPWR